MNKQEPPKTEGDSVQGVVDVFPNENGCGAHVVVPHSMKRVTCGKDEVLRIRLKLGKVDHAWVESRATAIRRESTIADLKSKMAPVVERFLLEVCRRQPRLEMGTASQLKFTIGVVGYGDDDEAEYEMTVKESHEDSL